MTDKTEQKMEKIESSRVPAAIGPYSQAVMAGDYVFVSGQIPISTETGKILRTGIREQTSVVLGNIENILAEKGLGLADVVKVDVFLTDMNDFSDVDEVYSLKFAQEIKPARCVVEVSNLPKDVDIEVSCIAYRGN
jgi:2-iminobutanoate/2-iminopropanoate deaminase